MNRYWMIYGANGYTGRRAAEEAVVRGWRPVLAGRNRAAITSLAESLDCPWRVFELDDSADVAKELEGIGAVLHCAGPFSRTWRPMVEGCLSAGTHYLDITGEIDVLEGIAALSGAAAKKGIILMPAVGFDVVPSDCLAVMLSRRLPGATHLRLAFTGTGSISRGTARTMVENLPRGGRARIDGEIQRVPIAWKSRRVPFSDGAKEAVTIPWGDVATAYYSTGIRNIEVYMALPGPQIRALRLGGGAFSLLRFIPSQWSCRLVRSLAGKNPGSSRGSLWGQVEDAGGNTLGATLLTPEPYRLTVLTALECVKRTMDAGAAGFHTPGAAYGGEFILEFEGVEYQEN